VCGCSALFIVVRTNAARLSFYFAISLLVGLVGIHVFNKNRHKIEHEAAEDLVNGNYTKR